MKKVLIADNHALFREFLKTKLSEDQVEVILTQENRDTYTKMITAFPNLIILDMPDDNTEEMAFLEKKGDDSNAVNIPVIITGPTQERANIAALAKYGVIKYFEKPIQFDIFFDAISNVLHIPLSMDTSPCVLDLHRNGNIIFIELALGLNRDKISLLQYKLTEMINQEHIDYPKVVIMLTNLELSFVDGYNLEFLIDNVIACPKIHNKNVKILSLSPFVRDLLSGHKAYGEIEMATNLSRILNSLVDTTITSSVSDLITDKILSNSYGDTSGLIDTRFSSDSQSGEAPTGKDGTVLNIAVIDSNPQALGMTQLIFNEIGATTTGFTNGPDFIKAYEPEKFNLIILDVLLTDQTGLSILENLRKQRNTTPILVYSQSLQREFIVKVLSLGANGYQVKPAKQSVLVQKALNLLNGIE